MAIKYQDSQAGSISSSFHQPDNFCSAAWIDRRREEKNPIRFSIIGRIGEYFFQISEKKFLARGFENNSLS